MLAAAAADDDDGGGGGDDDDDGLGFILNPIRLLMLVIVRWCCWVLINLNNYPPCPLPGVFFSSKRDVDGTYEWLCRGKREEWNCRW